MFRKVSVECAPYFIKVLTSCDKNSKRYKEVDYILDLLKQDPLHGDQIRKKIWPTKYVQKYGIHNLFRVRLSDGWRLIYTDSTNRNAKIVSVLDVLSHKEYEKVFGY